jgi:hypothetical protein
VFPNGKVVDGWSFVMLDTEQLSPVTGVPRATPIAVQDALVVVFTFIGAVIVGGILSSTITFWFAVVEFPFPSSKVHVTIVVPLVVIGKTVSVVPVMVPAQASVVVGAVGVPAHCPTLTFANVGVKGGTLSFTVIV